MTETGRHDEATPAAVSDASFAAPVAVTKCPYAGLAVWRQVTVDPCMIDEHGFPVLESVGRDIRSRIVADAAAGLDMRAIEVNHHSVVTDLETCSRAVALFIRGLLGADALPDSDTHDDWVANVDGERLFIFALCPFYDDRHPRRSGTDSLFIVIQYLNSFFKINMHRMTLADKRRLSDRVKSVFTAAGLDYFAYITQGTSEALKVVKPLRQGDDPVRWWQTL